LGGAADTPPEHSPFRPTSPPIDMREHMLAAQEHALQVDVVGSRTVLTDSLTDAGFRFDDPLDC